MPFANSVLGHLNTRMWSNPLIGTAATAGLASGAVAGLSSFAGTEGPAGARADAGASSALRWGAVGTLGVGGVLISNNIAGSFRAGWEGYRGPGAAAYGTARNFRDMAGFGSRTVVQGGRSYAESLVSELRTAGGWKKTIMRPGVSGGLGAIVGAAVGHHMTGDNRGAVAGAAIGGAAGMVASRAVVASRAWSAMGGESKLLKSAMHTGIIGSTAIFLGAGLAAFHGSEPEAVEQAQAPDNGYTPGVGSRLDKVGASGDMVFGLHRRR